MSGIASTALLLTLATAVSGSRKLTPEDEKELSTISWMNWPQVRDAYIVEVEAAERFGRKTGENPDGLHFYPEHRVLENTTVVVFCLLNAANTAGYRTNGIYLQLLQEGFTHKVSLLAPKRKLVTHADQQNCWNYVQESVCQPLRDCDSPGRPQLRTVGFITRQGWGIFQLVANKLTRAHYQCLSQTQTILSGDELKAKNLNEYIGMQSDVAPLEVFESSIGEPQLIMASHYPRGKPVSVHCQVSNSRPGSSYVIQLALMRPPPAGHPGRNRRELLASRMTSASEASGLLQWNGEPGLLSLHGLQILCSVLEDWGARRGRRIASGVLMISYMFPVYLDNPRLKMFSIRSGTFKKDFYATPGNIHLRHAEYAVCKADGYPPTEVQWNMNQSDWAWIIDETLFVPVSTNVGESYKASCTATSPMLGLSDTVDVIITVMASNRSPVAWSAATCIVWAITTLLLLL